MDPQVGCAGGNTDCRSINCLPRMNPGVEAFSREIGASRRNENPLVVDYLWEYNHRHAKTRSGSTARGSTARHAGPADSANTGAGDGARTHYRARDRAPLGGSAASGARLALSGAAPAGGSRLDRVVLGHVRK